MQRCRRGFGLAPIAWLLLTMHSCNPIRQICLYYLLFRHSKHINCGIYTVFVSLTFLQQYLYLYTVTQHQTINKRQLRWSHTLKPLITALSLSSLHSSSFPFLLFEQKQWIKSCFYLMCPLAPQTQPTDTHLHWLAVNWFYTSVIPRPGYNRNWN